MTKDELPPGARASCRQCSEACRPRQFRQTPFLARLLSQSHAPVHKARIRVVRIPVSRNSRASLCVVESHHSELRAGYTFNMYIYIYIYI